MCAPFSERFLFVMLLCCCFRVFCDCACPVYHCLLAAIELSLHLVNPALGITHNFVSVSDCYAARDAGLHESRINFFSILVNKQKLMGLGAALEGGNPGVPPNTLNIP